MLLQTKAVISCCYTVSSSKVNSRCLIFVDCAGEIYFICIAKLLFFQIFHPSLCVQTVISNTLMNNNIYYGIIAWSRSLYTRDIFSLIQPLYFSIHYKFHEYVLVEYECYSFYFLRSRYIFPTLNKPLSCTLSHTCICT